MVPAMEAHMVTTGKGAQACKAMRHQPKLINENVLAVFVVKM